MIQKVKLIIICACFLVLSNEYIFSEEESGCRMISAGPVAAWTAPVCCKGEFVVQPFFTYNRARGVFDSDSEYKSFSGGDRRNQYLEQLFAQLGVTDRLEIDGQIELQENYIKVAGESASSTGVGDSFVWMRYCAIEGKNNLPYVTGLFQVRLPTGKYEHSGLNHFGTDLTGTGSYDFGPGLILTQAIGKCVFHADVIYSFPMETDIDEVNTQHGNYFNYDAGIEYFFYKGFNVLFELNGFAQGDMKEDGRKISDSGNSYFVAGTGLGWSNEKIQTLLAYQRTVLGENNYANDSVIFTFVYGF
jgi:hypothetical protein